MYKYIQWRICGLNFSIKWCHCKRTAVLCPRMRKQIQMYSSARESSYWECSNLLPEARPLQMAGREIPRLYRTIIFITRQQELSFEPTQNQLDTITTLMICDLNVYFNIIITHTCKFPKKSVSFFNYSLRLLQMPSLFLLIHDFGFGSTALDYSQIIH